MYNINIKIMKKLFVISTALIFGFLTSCRSDSDNESQKLMITGNWRPDKIMTTTTSNGSTTTTTVITDDCQQTGRLMFSANNTGKVKYFDKVDGTCSLIIDLDMIYTYNPDSKEFSITTNGNKMDGAVTSLSANNMVVYYIDKSNPTSTNKVEICATRVAN